MSKERELLERAALILSHANGLSTVITGGLQLEDDIRDYLTQPEKKREALSKEAIEREWQKMDKDDKSFRSQSFLAGIRFAERHHGIGREE